MIVSFCLILLAILIMLFKGKKTLFNISFIVAASAIEVLIFAIIFYITKTVTYYSIFPFERELSHYISSLPITYFGIGNIVNISLVLYLIFTQLLFIYDIKYSTKRRFLTIISVLFLIVGIYIILNVNSQKMYEKIYILQNTAGEEERAAALVHLIEGSILILTTIFVLPIVRLAAKLKESRIYIKEKMLRYTLTYAVLMGILYLLLLIFGPTRIFLLNFNLHNFGAALMASEQMVYLYMCICSFVVIALVAVFVVKYNMFDIPFASDKYNKDTIFADDIRHVFHSYKNAMFSIAILAEEALNNYGSEESVTAIKKIKSNVQEYSKKSNEFLDVYNNSQWEYEIFETENAVRKAIKKTDIFKNIEFEVLHGDNKSTIYGVESVITEVIENIIINAEEAIFKAKREEGRIEISTFCEAQWICISIKDNGIGMDKKMCKRVFSPFYTTKNASYSWGIGLTYVNNAVLMHGGYVSVKSTLGEGTEFQIILPNERI